LILQWGSPLQTVAYLRNGFPKDLVGGFGVDTPLFDLPPESTNFLSMSSLWLVRAEAKRYGWPQLPFDYCEGPCLPTSPGHFTLVEQAEHMVRTYLVGLAYGVDQFPSATILSDAGSYYGAEHYGSSGLLNRFPIETPKPSVAAVATTTAMLCGTD